MSVAAILCFIRACPEKTIRLFRRLLSSTAFMRSFRIPCLLFGKVNAHPSRAKMRIISPLPLLLQVADVLISQVVDKTVTSSCMQIPRVWVGARPQTQTLDIARGIHVMLEKALDNFSTGAYDVQTWIPQIVFLLPTSMGLSKFTGHATYY